VDEGFSLMAFLTQHGRPSNTKVSGGSQPPLAFD
jgi:hypothetical protein